MSRAYFDHHIALLKALHDVCHAGLAPSAQYQHSEARNTADQEILDTLEVLVQSSTYDDTFQQQGQWLIDRIVSRYPQFTAHVHRELFWFFGGDCLHYLSDGELDQFQQMDELLHDSAYAGKALDYNTARAKVLKLH